MLASEYVLVLVSEYGCSCQCQVSPHFGPSAKANTSKKIGGEYAEKGWFGYSLDELRQGAHQGWQKLWSSMLARRSAAKR
jgi:hypothetical protein